MQKLTPNSKSPNYLRSVEKVHAKKIVVTSAMITMVSRCVIYNFETRQEPDTFICKLESLFFSNLCSFKIFGLKGSSSNMKPSF